MDNDDAVNEDSVVPSIAAVGDPTVNNSLPMTSSTAQPPPRAPRQSTRPAQAGRPADGPPRTRTQEYAQPNIEYDNEPSAMLFEQRNFDDDIQSGIRVRPMTGPATEGVRVQPMAQVDISNDTARFVAAQGGSFNRTTPVDMFDGVNIQTPNRSLPSHSMRQGSNTLSRTDVYTEPQRHEAYAHSTMQQEQRLVQDGINWPIPARQVRNNTPRQPDSRPVRGGACSEKQQLLSEAGKTDAGNACIESC